MEKSIGKFIFWFSILLCIWYKCYFAMTDNKRGPRRDFLTNTAQFKTLFSDNITTYLQAKEPKWFAKCAEKDLQCQLFYAENFPNDKKDILCLQYRFSEKMPFVPNEGYIDSFPCSHSINVLYSRQKKDYTILYIKDLLQEKSRYQLKTFLIKNDIQVKDAQQLFQYLYLFYGENDIFRREGEVCGFPYFYSIHDFEKIPLMFGASMYVRGKLTFFPYKAHNAYNAYFRGKIRTVLEEYQKEANNYYCGAILGFNPNIGQWTLYFFVVNDIKPIDYKVYVFQTPPNKDYTWQNLRDPWHILAN